MRLLLLLLALLLFMAKADRNSVCQQMEELKKQGIDK